MIDQLIKATPIPGMSLTTEPGSRPWERPPQLVTIDDAAKHYIEKLTSEKVIDGLVRTTKAKVPLLSIANTAVRAGVMKGVHTVPLGFLVTPIIVELLINLCEQYGLDYTVADKPKGMYTAKESDLFGVLAKSKETPENIKEEVSDAATKVSGLMSKGAK